MNFFKATLLSTMIAGLACANVSAIDPQDGEHQLFEQEQTVVSNNDQTSGANQLSPEELNILLEELEAQAAQHGIELTFDSELAQPMQNAEQEMGQANDGPEMPTRTQWLAALALSGIFGASAYFFAAQTLGTFGEALQVISHAEFACGTSFSSLLAPFSGACFGTAFRLTVLAVLGSMSASFAKIMAKSSLNWLVIANDPVKMKAAINLINTSHGLKTVQAN